MARGFCESHYAKARYRGELRRIKDIPNDERFDACWQLDELTGCHVWFRGKDSSGYGQFNVIGGDRRKRAHVYAWERAHGPVPEGLVVDHYVCDNKSCCNPDHLRLASSLANVMRPKGSADYPPATLREATPGHCIHGHEWTAENTYTRVDRSGRTRKSCRACHHERSARAAAKAKADRHARGARSYLRRSEFGVE